MLLMRGYHYQITCFIALVFVYRYSKGSGATSITFDLSLMICLIRNLTTTSPPINGFDKLPLPSETSVGADIARIKFVRNLLAHNDKNTMSNSDFSLHWSCLHDAIVRQGTSVLKIKCDDIKNLRLVNEVEIQDFYKIVADFKHVLLAEVSEIEDRISNVEDRVSEVEKENSGIGDRVTRVEEKVNVNYGKFSGVEDRVTGVDDRVSGVEDRLTGVDYRVSGVEDRLTGVDYRVSGVEDRFTCVDDRVSGVGDRLTGVNYRVSGVEDRVTGVEDKVTGVADQILTVMGRVSVAERGIEDLKKKDVQSIVPSHLQERFQKRIQEWQKEDEKFVTTAASIHVIKCVERNGCVSVIGNSGTGKTFTARHTALQMERQGYLIVPVTDPRDLDYFQHGRKTLFVIDDFCGRFTFNEGYSNDWRRALETIESLMKDKCFKMITTCRLQVYQDEKFKLLSLFKTCVCNLSTPEFRLKSDEIDSLVETYASDVKDSLPQISDNIDFYPLLFNLYNKNKNKCIDVKTFFSHPYECYKDDIDTLEIEGSKGKLKYCGLVLCVMFNNTLSVNDILGKNLEREAIIKEVLVECEAERENRKTICKELETLNDSLVVKKQEIYMIIHDKLFDFLAKYFGEKITDIFIKYAHSDFIKERFLLATFKTDEEAEVSINITDEYTQMYIDRLFSDWGKGEIKRVFANRNMKSTEFRKTLFTCLKEQSKEVQEKLLTIQDKETLDTPLHGVSIYGDVDQVRWMIEKCDAVSVSAGNRNSETPLYIACENGQLDLVRYFIHSGSNIKTQTINGWSLLHKACFNNHVHVVKELIKQDQIEINTSTNLGSTALYLACQEGHVDVIRVLLQHSANVNTSDEDGWTPLHIACYKNHAHVVNELLKQDQIEMNTPTNLGSTALFLACQEGHVDVIRLLLQHSANINKADLDGWTPLHKACFNNHVHVVNELLKQDQIEMNSPTNLGSTALFLACQEGHVDVIRLLLQQSANINKADLDGWTPLHISCYKNHVLHVVNELLKQDQININIPNNEGSTSLYLACRKGHIDIIRLLLEHSADVNKADFEGFTPLIIACQNMHIEIVIELLNHTADVDAKVYDGDNAIISACRNECNGIVEILLQYGADPNACLPTKSVMESNIVNKSKRTVEEDFAVWYDEIYRKVADDLKQYLFAKPVQYTFDLCAGSSCLHFASLLGSINTVQILIKHSANVNMAKEDGTTPLFIACEFGHLDVVKLLLDEGGKTDLGRIDGLKPLDIATANGHIDVASCLKNHDDMVSNVRGPDDSTSQIAA